MQNNDIGIYEVVNSWLRRPSTGVLITWSDESFSYRNRQVDMERNKCHHVTDENLLL